LPASLAPREVWSRLDQFKFCGANGSIAAKHKCNRLNVLVIEDSEDDAFLLVGCFKRAGYTLDFRRVENAGRTREALLNGRWDAVLSDHSMPGFNALAALELMQELQLDLPFIIVSGVIDEETAIAAMRAGAHDYLSKNRLDRLVPAVEREIREAKHRAERRAALDSMQENEARFRALVSNIPGMVFQLQQSARGACAFLYVNEGSTRPAWPPQDSLLADSRLSSKAIHGRGPRIPRCGLADSATKIAQANWDGRILEPPTEPKNGSTCGPRRAAPPTAKCSGKASSPTSPRASRRRTSCANPAASWPSCPRTCSAKEEERERIARDIHDELGGTLVAIKFETSLLASKLPGDPLQLRKRVRNIEGPDRRRHQHRRPRVARAAARHPQGLRPRRRHRMPGRRLLPAGRLNCDTTGITTYRPGRETSLALFRIFQEALTNVAKHAHAT
jgi:two-component system sensor histidine kinase UhpB